jgi:hypothetical protein
MTVDSSKNVKLYINGTLSRSAVHGITDWTPSSGNASVPLCIGTLYPYGEGWGGNTGFTFDGKIDDARMYNRVLSATEIAALYNSNQTKINAPQDTKITNGLVGFWTFNGKDVGTTIVDVSGQNNHGYVFGAATSTSVGIGKVGQGLKLDGANNYVQVANSSSLDMTGAVTMSAWIKTSTTNDYAGIIQKSNSSTVGYQMGFSTAASGQLRCDLANGVGYAAVGNSANVLDGKWHHVLCVYNGTTAQLYVDNVSGGGTPLSNYNAPSGVPVTIGFDRCCGPSRKFNGIIDEARIYNRALTAAEIKQLYLLGR